MKRLLSIGILALFLNSCDDGDIVYKQPNFESNAIQKCENKDLYYKINAKDMMILKDNSKVLSENNFKIGETRSVQIGSSLELISRSYSEQATAASICDALPPVNPIVVKEIMANAGGTAMITRDFRVLNSEGESTSTTISYFFTIRFTNISFKDGENDIKQTDFSFGEFIDKKNTLSFSFKAADKVQSCSTENQNRLVNFSDSEAMVLNVPNEALSNIEKDQKFDLSETNNLIYKQFNVVDGTILDLDKACSSETEFDKTIQTENWNGTAGQLRVVTTKVIQGENTPEQKTQFLHKLTFEKITFTKEGKSFVKEAFPFGEITTQL